MIGRKELIRKVMRLRLTSIKTLRTSKSYECRIRARGRLQAFDSVLKTLDAKPLVQSPTFRSKGPQ